ncbi:MAG: SIS domain-containing protein [Gudongella sp.]|jgi:phosphoheptose isomerase/phosphoglycolate phosphatase-like HAD superfamily hydrolase|nr:SIS domain-containing protein [Gudongella sp.]
MTYYSGSNDPVRYSKEVSEALNKTDFDILKSIADEVVKRKIDDRMIFTAGNGGSSATSSHLINDLIKGCRIDGREGFRAVSLNDSTAILTCLANDFSYEEVFSIQLRTLGRAGDLLIVYSGSGNSPNIVHVLDTAKKMGITTVAFGGRDGGKMKELCDHILIAPTYSMEQIEDLHMVYNHALIMNVRERLMTTWDVEIINYPSGNKPKYAIFDFDGTVSLVREGWQPIMYEYFTEELLKAPNAPKVEDAKKLVMDFVDTLTGKQTIFQCIHLAEEIEKFGGEPKDPLEYKAEYLRRLEIQIKSRKEALERGEDTNKYLVPGVEELLKMLNDLGIECYLTSGTDEVDVINEAKLLKIDHYFKGIHGATDKNTTLCSQEEVLKDLIEKESLEGSDLLTFGDGFVEIELAKNTGSYAIAIASNEKDKDGSVDKWKRERLIRAGADCVIPDFSDNKRLMDFLGRSWNEF